jgi:hypothetical protein
VSGAAAPAQPAVAPAPTPRGAGEACPLCGAPLHPEQEWCLHCGAAARTRLAASPNWRAPLLAALTVAVLSLGVLAAALVKLAGGSESSAPPATTTVTSTPAASAATPGAALPGTGTPTTSTAPATPGTTTPQARTTPPLFGVTPRTGAPRTSSTRSGAPQSTAPSRAGKGVGPGNGLTPALEKRLAELRRLLHKKGK